MDREIDHEENSLAPTELNIENNQANDLPKIEEKAEQPTVCGECRTYLAQISAQTTLSNRPVTTAGWIGVNFLMMIPLTDGTNSIP